MFVLVIVWVAGVAAHIAPAMAGDQPSRLTVFAAASLRESMDEAARVYQQRTGVPVRVSYAASSTLARQIRMDAPADLFISADQDWMDYLQQHRKIVPASRRDVLGNRLVLIAPRAQARPVDLYSEAALLARLGDGRLAVARTRSVPAGKYAREAFIALGMWETIRRHCVETDNVRGALMLVARREAPLGVVYASDAAAESDVAVVAQFPEASHTRILYPVAAVRGSQEQAAERMIRWLISPEAAVIFKRHGFLVSDTSNTDAAR